MVVALFRGYFTFPPEGWKIGGLLRAKNFPKNIF